MCPSSWLTDFHMKEVWLLWEMAKTKAGATSLVVPAPAPYDARPKEERRATPPALEPSQSSQRPPMHIRMPAPMYVLIGASVRAFSHGVQVAECERERLC